MTSRLCLRRPLPDDVDAVLAYSSDPEVVRYLTFPRSSSVDDTRRFLDFVDESWQGGSEFTWAITHDQRLVGMVALRHEEEHRMTLGYVIARTAWGNGYATEAARAIVDEAFGAGVYRVEAVADVENAPSRRVLEKIGMEFEGVLHRHTVHPNVSTAPRDVALYAKWR